jgi:predicted NAD/FAD-binding protein
VRIAIVGTGIAGLVSAHMLQHDHDITVFEADDRVGGHANTVDVEVGGERHSVDTGFIVYNERNYPGFVELLREIGVATQPSEMSFGVSNAESGMEFRATNLNSIFAQRRNLLDRGALRFFSEIVRFNRSARRLVAGEPRWSSSDRLARSGSADAPTDLSDLYADESIAEFVRRGRFSRRFVSDFLVPFGASIWSADPEMFTAFPIRAYARFMDNHGLLTMAARPQWRTISGGSRRYVDAVAHSFADRIRLGCPVQKVVDRPADDGRPCVELLTGRGPESFDRVILATHSDQALRLLAAPTAAERSILGAIAYQPNTATLHTDDRMLPTNPRARASWNYSVRPDSRAATVTYWMNRLQSIESRRPLLVTLNRRAEIDDRDVLTEIEYQHPVFDLAAMAAQRRRHEIQGQRGIFFAGAYWGYGFHEDGVQSGREVVAAIEAGR